MTLGGARVGVGMSGQDGAQARGAASRGRGAVGWAGLREGAGQWSSGSRPVTRPQGTSGGVGQAGG